MSDEPCDLPHLDLSDGPMPRGQIALTGLVLVPTPLGNLGDMTMRAVNVLRAADLVLCEDSRVTARLFAAFDIHTRLLPLHDHNEDGRVAQVLAELAAGRVVALVSDAGTPLVSDPGYRLVRAVIAAGLPVTGLPGPNAALLALVLSGLPPHPYLFIGFPPRTEAQRRTGFTALRAAERAGLDATLIWYEAPHRLAETLADMAAVFGDRPAAVARELTKRFEEVRRGGLAALAAHYGEHAARGEITVVVGPAADATAEAADTMDARLAAALGEVSLKEAVAQVAAATGLPRREVYARALALSRRDPVSRET